MNRFLTTATLGLMTLLLADAARAADTVETWDAGATDVDFYLGYEGIGLREAADRGTFGDLMLGYGIVERFSVYVGTSLEANGAFGDGAASPYLGIFGTVVDTEHVDFDLFLDVSTGGPSLTEFAISPSLELNFDGRDDMSTGGLYTRVGVPLYGRGGKLDEMSLHLEAVIGAYYTVAPDHQLLLELDATFHPFHRADHDHAVEIGGVALGYNVTLSDRIELINQVFLDIPQSGEPVAGGVMVGFIVTLPSAGGTSLARETCRCEDGSSVAVAN